MQETPKMFSSTSWSCKGELRCVCLEGRESHASLGSVLSHLAHYFSIIVVVVLGFVHRALRLLSVYSTT